MRRRNEFPNDNDLIEVIEKAAYQQLQWIEEEEDDIRARGGRVRFGPFVPRLEDDDNNHGALRSSNPFQIEGLDYLGVAEQSVEPGDEHTHLPALRKGSHIDNKRDDSLESEAGQATQS